MSQKNILIIVIIVLIIVGGGLLTWYFLQEDTTINTNGSVVTTNDNTASLNSEKEMPAKGTVWISDGSFNPSVITIDAGDTVTWLNQDDIDRQVASDPYPSHSILPNLFSDVLSTGDEYQYTFEEAGTFIYHDYLNPISKGTIIVE